MGDVPDISDYEEEQYNTVNEIAIVGEFGFRRIEGPFTAEKDGTLWGIVIPMDTHPTVQTLYEQAGEAAAIIADGEVIGGGIVENVLNIDSHDEVHVVIDQYKMGKE